MRRDYELVRSILLEIANEKSTDSAQLAEKLDVESSKLNYHIDLMRNDAKLIKGREKSTMGLGVPTDEPDWTGIHLTWQGNDFLDSVADSKSWRKIQIALTSGAKIAAIEALKQLAKGAGAAVLGVVLSKTDDELRSISTNEVMSELYGQRRANDT